MSRAGQQGDVGESWKLWREGEPSMLLNGGHMDLGPSHKSDGESSRPGQRGRELGFPECPAHGDPWMNLH